MLHVYVAGGPGAAGLSFLLLRKDMPGVHVRKMETQTDGSHATTFITLDNVRAPRLRLRLRLRLLAHARGTDGCMQFMHVRAYMHRVRVAGSVRGVWVLCLTAAAGARTHTHTQARTHALARKRARAHTHTHTRTQVRVPVDNLIGAVNQGTSARAR
jgi:alkylation response protein AidB-like acyl-CoA dehydrogenase